MPSHKISSNVLYKCIHISNVSIKGVCFFSFVGVSWTYNEYLKSEWVTYDTITTAIPLNLPETSVLT